MGLGNSLGEGQGIIQRWGQRSLGILQAWEATRKAEAYTLERVFSRGSMTWCSFIKTAQDTVRHHLTLGQLLSKERKYQVLVRIAFVAIASSVFIRKPLPDNRIVSCPYSAMNHSSLWAFGSMIAMFNWSVDRSQAVALTKGGSSGESQSLPGPPPLRSLLVQIIATSSNSKPSPEFLWLWVFHLMWFLRIQLILKEHLLFQTTAQGCFPGRRTSPALNFLLPLSS